MELCEAAYHEGQLQESAHWLVEIDGWANGTNGTDGWADSWWGQGEGACKLANGAVGDVLSGVPSGAASGVRALAC